ncbi:MAG TPA: hypothetical protein VKA53_04820 [Thermoanaerobaculia bacterium]|nr:hypothetical protein [Thermoanaerobaculia bacterium]
MAGEVAKETMRGLTRRQLLRWGLGAALIGSGGWILKGVFFPRHLDPREVSTLDSLLATLLPATTPKLRDQLLEGLEGARQTRRALIEGVALLERRAQGLGATTFRALDQGRREKIVAELEAAPDGSMARFFYRVVRDRAFALYYSQAASWRPLHFPHPPQPDGYLDYQEPPDV